MFLAALKEVGEKEETATYYIYAEGATLGRHYDNTIVLLDPSVSRTHARLEFRDGRFYIQDLGSSNGVLVNDSKVDRRELKDFDLLTIGNIMLLFRTTELAKSGQNRVLLTQDRFLAAIKDIGDSAKSAALSQRVLEIAAEFAVTLTRAERAIIFLYDRSLNLKPAVFHNVSRGELQRDEFAVSRSTIEQALSTGELVIREPDRQSANHSMIALNLHTIICLPLKSPHALEASTAHDAETTGHFAKGMIFGVLYLDSRRPLKGLPEHRRTMLQVLADQTSLAIENALLQREMAEKQRLKKQMRAARAVQQRLFPDPEYSHPGFEMAFHFAAAQQIGGDYLNFIPLSETRFLIAIGDVVGKGLPAGLVVMTLHGGLYSEISHRQELPAMIRNLDRLIYEYAQGKVFVTFFLGILDVEAKRLEFSSAGHNPPLLRRLPGKEWEEVRAEGIPLGLDPTTPRFVETLDLQAGDLLLFYTDGITEARTKDRKQFGVAGLRHVVDGWLATQSRTPLTLAVLVKEVFAAVQRFTGSRQFEDDTTLMAVAVK
ncbi:MAG: SpoIIE family protein phosphatase [candidate division KSB1 bacterium]|nr:SpoIIE family protein phosphatase [candidate division KSB1 bacterium]MDZ7274373.1 SpoIIE family protein phosphatase [candidate division KSB1 bacterium]MDZ7284965.1 SpoIIE family protein phosphatase [candidate division KSB1 bacterium]MDZ7297614.1 SpoIIE family protein phosphatase [candidate division KSB1 bacterium]MDZ7306354.1 SpoIIE family protein phosphatase [candidate division KSB1 bacterium]